MPNQNEELLTEKEIIIAMHLQNGLSRDEIAEAEACSINTVHTHCRRMYRKLEVNNVTGLLKRLRENNDDKDL